jgi:hypothetical protein
MSFDRARQPDPFEVFQGEGLAPDKGGKWGTCTCPKHGGRSLRFNRATGAFRCMAGCDLSGGDLVAFRMQAYGESFIDAAKALGCWIDDGRPVPKRPTPLPARDAISLLARESNLIAVAAGNVAHGVALAQTDLDRVLAAAGRVQRISEVFA